MTPDDLRELLSLANFVPFRLHMGNGRTVDVRHPEMMVVSDDMAAVAVEENGRTRMRLLALVNINEVERLAPST